MQYDDTWDRPHTPGVEDFWQESDCYWFYDEKAGVGGYHRIGQHLNLGKGQVLLFAYRKDGFRFKLIKEFSSESLNRWETGQQVGGSLVEAPGGGNMNYKWRETDCEADLQFHEPFYTPRSWMKSEDLEEAAAKVKQKMNSGGHLEVSGRMIGTIRIGEETINLNALAHRVRSWGVRDLKAAYQHRMVTGTVGPELSWATYILQLSNGYVAKAGFVARNGKTLDIKDIRVLTEFDYDGLTVSSIKSRLHLENGQTLDITGNALQGFTALTDGWLLSSHHFIRVRHTGLNGFTILDATNRPSRGDFVPTPEEVSMVCMSDGLSLSKHYEDLVL